MPTVCPVAAAAQVVTVTAFSNCACCWRRLLAVGLGPQLLGEMHGLVAAFLLRVARLDAFDVGAQVSATTPTALRGPHEAAGGMGQ